MLIIEASILTIYVVFAIDPTDPTFQSKYANNQTLLLYRSPRHQSEHIQPDQAVTYKAGRLLIKSSSSEARDWIQKVQSEPISSESSQRPPLSVSLPAPVQALTPVSTNESAVGVPVVGNNLTEERHNSKLSQPPDRKKDSEELASDFPWLKAEGDPFSPVIQLSAHRSEGATQRSVRSETLRDTGSEPSLLRPTTDQISKIPP